MKKAGPSYSRRGQTILEFSAAMVVLCLIMYGMIQVFRWGVMDLAERRFDHDKTLVATTSLTQDQLHPRFHQTRPVDGTVYRK
jgi:hypothetical protein